MAAGLAARSAAGTVTYSAAAPGRSKPTRPNTSAPSAQPVPPGPEPATTPDRSWHGITGHFSGQVSSWAVTAVAATRTSTSPGPGCGTGTRSRLRLAASLSEACMARIVPSGLFIETASWSGPRYSIAPVLWSAAAWSLPVGDPQAGPGTLPALWTGVEVQVRPKRPGQISSAPERGIESVAQLSQCRREDGGVGRPEADDEARPALTGVEELAKTGGGDATSSRGRQDLLLVARRGQQGGEVQAGLGRQDAEPRARRPGGGGARDLVAWGVDRPGPARRRCRSIVPSSSSPVRAVWAMTGGCQSMSCLSAVTGPASDGGATANPIRSSGESTLENEPT